MPGKILIVDDDADYCKLLSLMLTQQACEVSVRHDPATGLTALRGMKPDLVILDLNMPRGGGKLFYQALRKDPLFKDLPVIVATANETGDSIYTMLDSPPHPATLIMRKPLDLKQLETLLQRRGR